MTFATALEAYHRAQRNDWGVKHAEQWRTSLANHAVPVLGDMPCAQINTENVLQVLRPIWSSTRTTASRVRQRIEAVLEYARVEEHRTGDNPARWQGHLEHSLGKKPGKDRAFPALHYDKLPAFMEKVAATEGIAARALEFAVLSAARAGEIRGATWSEIDLEARSVDDPSRTHEGRQGASCAPLRGRAGDFRGHPGGGQTQSGPRCLWLVSRGK